MSEVWRTAREWAADDLPGLPKSERGVRKMADRDGWPSRERQASGGGREYPLSALPLVARVNWCRRHFVVDAEMVRDAAAEPLAAALPAPAAVNRDARLALVQAADRFRQQSSGRALSIVASDAMFAGLYNVGRIEVPDWVKSAVGHLSTRSLARWRKAVREGRTTKLAVDKAAQRKGKGLLDLAEGGEVKTHILALIIHQPHLTAADVLALVEARFGPTLDVVDAASGEIATHRLPPVRTVQHFMKGLKEAHKVEIVAATDPDAFRSRYRVAGRGSLKHVTRPGQLWMIDASPADLLLTEGRHSVYVAIDVATRRMMVYVSKTPRAAAVGLLIRRAVLAWGAPEAIKTDNGSDFVAVATQRLFAALDIEAIPCSAYQPQEKGHVERAIGTLQRGLMPLLPGFIGHSVADRKRIESRKSFAQRLGEDAREVFSVDLDAAGLQRRCDEWVDHLYHHKPHDGLKGRTPFEVAAASAEVVRTVDARALDMLLAPVAGKSGYRTVTKSGLRIDGHHYLVGSVLPETNVFVRMDPTDLGRVFLFASADGDFLGEGICPSAAGIDPAAAVKAVREAQRALIDDRMNAAKAEAKKIAKGPILADLIIEQAKAKAPNLVAFPKPQRSHETPQITAALAATAPRAEPVHAPEIVDMHRRLVAEAATPAQPVVPLRTEETRQQRFRRALELEAAIEARLPVDPRDALWLGGYQAEHEYRAMRGLYEDFGERALR